MKKICCFVLLCSLLSGCSMNDQPVQKTVFAMDTVMDLKIWGPDAQTSAAQVEAMLNQLEAEWSATLASSVIGQLNRGKSVALTQEQTQLLTCAEELHERTGGAFDPKLHSLSLAWGFPNQQYRVPDESELAEAIASPRWDLGALVKGYAGQQAAELLQQYQVTRAVLNLGGNTQTYGEKADGTPWQIAIQNPKGEGYAGVISVTGTTSIVTSGDYQRYFEQDGAVYHHILDPKTGYPANSGLSSVTVVCRDGATADALSTGLFVMGLDAASAHWRQSDDFEAVFILSDGRIFATEGVALSGCTYEVIAREN